MSRSNYDSNAGSNKRPTGAGKSALDYIKRASGHFRRDKSPLHPNDAHAPKSTAGSRRLEGTISPNDSISNISTRSSYAPSQHGGRHSVAASRPSPSMASGNTHLAPSFSGPSYAALSRPRNRVPHAIIRELTSDAGSRHEAAEILAKYNERRSAARESMRSMAWEQGGSMVSGATSHGSTVVTRATMSGGALGGRSATAGTIAKEKTITVSETASPSGKVETVVKIYKAGEMIEE